MSGRKATLKETVYDSLNRDGLLTQVEKELILKYLNKLKNKISNASKTIIIFNQNVNAMGDYQELVEKVLNILNDYKEEVE